LQAEAVHKIPARGAKGFGKAQSGKMEAFQWKVWLAELWRREKVQCLALTHETTSLILPSSLPDLPAVKV